MLGLYRFGAGECLPNRSVSCSLPRYTLYRTSLPSVPMRARREVAFCDSTCAPRDFVPSYAPGPGSSMLVGRQAGMPLMMSALRPLPWNVKVGESPSQPLASLHVCGEDGEK